jgi:hypothetical protein
MDRRSVELRDELSRLMAKQITSLEKETSLAWIIHEVSSQKRKDALKGMMITGFRHPAFPFGASIA